MEAMFPDNVPFCITPSSATAKTSNVLYISGKTESRKREGVIKTSFVEEARVMMENMKTTIEAKGSTIDQLVKVNAFLADIENVDQFYQIFLEFFKGKKVPSLTMIEAKLWDSLHIEIDAIVRKVELPG